MGVRWQMHTDSFRTCTAVVAQLFFMLHAPVSRTLFQWFNCRRIGGKHAYVRSDLSTRCFTPEYLSYSWAVVVPLLLVFCLGLPLFMIAFLFRNRKHLRTPKIMSRVGWLYSRYRPGTEFWDIHELLRKLVLCCALIFVGE